MNGTGFFAKSMDAVVMETAAMATAFMIVLALSISIPRHKPCSAPARTLAARQSEIEAIFGFGSTVGDVAGCGRIGRKNFIVEKRFQGNEPQSRNFADSQPDRKNFRHPLRSVKAHARARSRPESPIIAR